MPTHNLLHCTLRSQPPLRLGSPVPTMLPAIPGSARLIDIVPFRLAWLSACAGKHRQRIHVAQGEGNTVPGILPHAFHQSLEAAAFLWCTTCRASCLTTCFLPNYPINAYLQGRVIQPALFMTSRSKARPYGMLLRPHKSGYAVSSFSV